MRLAHDRPSRLRRSRPAKASLGAALACLAFAAPADARSASSSSAGFSAARPRLEARVDGGIVRGALEHDVIAYKGIPYARPPEGALRWAAPQPVKPWKGTRPALHFGPDCAQLPTPGDAAPLRTVSKENCLYLNVWRPASGRGLPVMVWIYGGGFVDGGTSPAVYDGTRFARDGVVLVSFNYRLGNLGFFAFPALDRQDQGALLGNYAFMDQIAALKWVQRNAAAFGGDPHNVTLFGESAGGTSVNALLMTPLAAGLFQRAIIESGWELDNAFHARPLIGSRGSAQAVGLRLARHLGIEGEGEGALAELRALPAAKLVDGLNMVTSPHDPTYAGAPILDGKLYLGAPAALYAAGGGARVPIMIGTNTAEIGALSAHSLSALWASFGEDAAPARALYDPDGQRTLAEIADAAGGDQQMVEPARAIARLLSARGQRVYEYRFGYVASALRKTFAGAPHASEIPFVFDTVVAHYGDETSRADEAMARTMHAYWVAFAKTGRPDPSGLPGWPEYHESTDRLLSFTERGPVAEADPWKRRLDLAERVTERAHRDLAH